MSEKKKGSSGDNQKNNEQAFILPMKVAPFSMQMGNGLINQFDIIYEES